MKIGKSTIIPKVPTQNENSEREVHGSMIEREAGKRYALPSTAGKGGHSIRLILRKKGNQIEGKNGKR